MDLVILHKMVTGKLPLRAEQYREMKNEHIKTRSNEKRFLYSKQCNRQRCRCNFSTELQATTIRCDWRVIFPIVVHIQVLPNSLEKSENIYLI